MVRIFWLCFKLQVFRSYWYFNICLAKALQLNFLSNSELLAYIKKSNHSGNEVPAMWNGHCMINLRPSTKGFEYLFVGFSSTNDPLQNVCLKWGRVQNKFLIWQWLLRNQPASDIFFVCEYSLFHIEKKHVF